MTWLVDPASREMLPAFEPADRTLRRLGGALAWPGGHGDFAVGWEQSTVDNMGFQYVRPCRRECCTPAVDPKFWAKVERTTGCWEWQGYRDRQGYGRLTRDYANDGAHRHAYRLLNGPFTGVIRHTCDNPPCVRPDHLLLGTQADNIDDRQSRGRHRPGRMLGQAHPAHKLSDDDVIEMRRLREQGWTVRALAAAFQMDYGHTCDIVNRKVWKHLP